MGGNVQTSGWQKIWHGEGAKRLWSIPDKQVVKLARIWKTDSAINRVLDIGCGLGRHALHLATEGFDVYGSDHSESAIQSCRDWIESQGLSAHLWCEELEEGRVQI